MSPTPTYTADASERRDTRETLTRQSEFQISREATQLLAEGELQPRRATREPVQELSFAEDIYQKKSVDEKPRAETAPMAVAERKPEPDVVKVEDARRPVESVAQQRPLQPHRDLGSEEIAKHVQQFLSDFTNGHPDQIHRSIRKLFNQLSDILGFSSNEGVGGSGGGGGFGSSWGRGDGDGSGGKGGRGRGGGRGRAQGESGVSGFNAGRPNLENELTDDRVPREPGIDFIDGGDVPHQLWRTFRQNGFPAINDDSLVVPNNARRNEGGIGKFDASPRRVGDSRDVFCNDQNLNSFREKLSFYNRNEFESELKQLVGKYQRYEANANRFRTDETADRVESGLSGNLEDQRGQDLLDKLAARLDASPILDDLEKSRIKFLEQSIMTGDVQNIMLLLNTDDNEDMTMAMSVLDKELRPLGIGVKYNMENGVGNMYITSNAENGFIKINKDEAEMHDGRGSVDRVFYDTASSNSDRNVQQESDDDRYRQYYQRYRDEIRAGMPVPSYEDYVSMYTPEFGETYTRY